MVNNLMNSSRSRSFNYYKNEKDISAKYDKNFDILRKNTLIKQGPVFSYVKIISSKNTSPYSSNNTVYKEETNEPLNYSRFIR
jgi:hypothetical protein